MKKLKIELEHCYGIKKLEHTFKFDDKNKVFAVYAQNGCMKTSFAKTFQDVMNNQVSKDNVFPNRKTIREILFDNKDISPETIFVIDPYNKKDDESEKISTLLASKELKQQYDDIHKKIDTIKNQLFNELRQLSGKKDKNTQLEDYILSVFGGKKFYDTILDLKDKVSKNESLDFCDIDYNTIFNKYVEQLLNKNEIKDIIKQYIEKYNELIEKSKYLNKDFNFHNAENLSTPLKNNNFFKARHSINLFDGTYNARISSTEGFDSLLKDEKDKIFNNDELQQLFNKIDNKIKNKPLKEFRKYLLQRKNILPELGNINNFKQKVWLSYFTEHNALFVQLVKAYKDRQKNINNIIDLAKNKENEWDKAVEKFYDRFVDLPFELEINNKTDAILKGKIPDISFIFTDEKDKNTYKKKEELLKILSTGETRALYILNIIFEVEARKQNNEETLFIVDDIADSFDYKNKYAIIEYLKEISEINNFYMIILTHNFDLFRTLESRGVSPYNSCLIAIKNNENIELQQFEGLKNPFINDWINNLSDKKKLIASIPFVRNLIEYTRGTQDTYYSKLTSFLHIKENTENITLNNIKKILKKFLKKFLKEFYLRKTSPMIT